MVMKKDGRKRDIKSKLVAAVCMLLVSCIMMVSSTYAWFTLSTAPEVTGITTAIGANGNLEMALIPGMNGNTAYATIADAMAAIGNASGSTSTNAANITWGNLVDLSEGYGLDKITLYPSTMEATNGVVPSNYLSTPTYGADGRFSGLKQTASAAIYNVSAFNTTGFGVRAIGTSSGMTALELDYRSALAAGNNALQSAIASSKTAVSTGGSKLASMAVTKATGTETFTAADKNALVDAYTAMETAIGHMETALKNYIIADYLSSGIEESTYATTLENMEEEDLATLAARSGINTAMKGYAGTLATLKSNVANSKSGLSALTGDTFTWDQLKSYVTALADIEAMKLNGEPMSYWMEKSGDTYSHLGELVSQMSNLVMTINADGKDKGYYSQLADFVNDFSTPATISGISYQGISADNLKVTMNVYATVENAYLDLSKAEAAAYTGSPFGTGGTNLTDFYGYILDMAFRTNAADSYLKLQTEGVDRIYADNTANPTTMGGGSTISYKIPAHSDYSTDKLINLMSYIRVVFFDPAANNTILGYAKLDTATAEIDGSATAGWTVKMQIKMTDGNGGDFKTGTDSQKIVDLVQNTATAVSTMVYLDGVNLSNADIANANLTGTMNLQFASSAELNPMEYGDLRKESTETTDEFDVTLSLDGTTQTLGKVAKGASYTLDVSQYTTAYDIVVKVNGSEMTGAIVDNQLSLTDVQGKVEIIATSKTP